jgi:hypothetical protein
MMVTADGWLEGRGELLSIDGTAAEYMSVRSFVGRGRRPSDYAVPRDAQR